MSKIRHHEVTLDLERWLSGLKQQVANLCLLWGPVGSNPTLSANFHFL